MYKRNKVSLCVGRAINIGWNQSVKTFHDLMNVDLVNKTNRYLVTYTKIKSRKESLRNQLIEELDVNFNDKFAWVEFEKNLNALLSSDKELILLEQELHSLK